MEFLKKVVGSVGTRKSGCAPNFPYTIQEPPFPQPAGFPWGIYRGRGTKSDEHVTIFVADTTNYEASAAAKNMLQRLCTLRHPTILRYVASAETASRLFIAVEEVIPLKCFPDNQWRQTDYLLWLIFDLIVHCSSKFLHEEAMIVHGNLQLHSLYVTVAGELRIGGLELASSTSDNESLMTDFTRYLREIQPLDWPPELSSPNQSMPWGRIRNLPIWTVDSFMVGKLIRGLFKDLNMPPEIADHVKRAMSADPRERRKSTELINARVFTSVPIIKIAEGFGEVIAMDPARRELFFRHVGSSLGSIAPQYAAYRIAPTLKGLLPRFLTREISLEGIRLYLQASSRLPDSEMSSTMVDGLVMILSSSDRAVRMVFLECLPLFVEKLDASLVQEVLYPALIEGFSDSLPVLREGSLRASLLMVPKLTSRQLNGELVRLYARLQNDVEASIRVNTVVCIGKIASFLEQGLRRKLLASTYVKASADSFAPVRAAALAAIPVTMEFLDEEGIARQLLPAICQLLIDPDRRVRSAAFSVADALVKKLQAATDAGAELEEDPENASPDEPPRDTVPTVRTSQPSWAISAFAEKIMNVALGSDTPGGQPPIGLETTNPPSGDGWSAAEGDILGLEVGLPETLVSAEPIWSSEAGGLWTENDPWKAGLGSEPSRCSHPHSAAKMLTSEHAAKWPRHSKKPLTLTKSTKPDLLKDL